MTPCEVYEFTVEMLPTSIVFLPVHRIRLDVTSSDSPNFDRNHNTGRNDLEGRGARHRPPGRVPRRREAIEGDAPCLP